MAKFRKKPVVIDAAQASVIVSVFPHLATCEPSTLPQWTRDAIEDGTLVVALDRVAVNTLEGQMVAGEDDWIIRGVKGELYPCKPDIFEATYEAVS